MNGGFANAGHSPAAQEDQPLAPDDPRHGTSNGYGNLRCRCDACRTARTDYFREAKIGSYAQNECACGDAKLVAAKRCLRCEHAARTPSHGTEGRYVSRGCRCADCREASRVARAKRRASAAGVCVSGRKPKEQIGDDVSRLCGGGPARDGSGEPTGNSTEGAI